MLLSEATCVSRIRLLLFYRYFYIYLKPRSRPWPRLQSWLHTPTHVCIFKIIPHWLSNWYWTILLDIDIWDTCLWDTHRDPMCLKSIQTAFRPHRYVSRNQKLVNYTWWWAMESVISGEVSDERCNWRRAAITDFWRRTSSHMLSYENRCDRRMKLLGKFQPAEFTGDAGTFKPVSSDIEEARQATDSLREFSLQRNHPNCSMQSCSMQVDSLSRKYLECNSCEYRNIIQN